MRGELSHIAGRARGPRPGGRARRAGFTLVELLVVIGIIALLAGILVPTLWKSRGLGELSVCQSNIRLLQLGNDIYQRDYDGFYAPAAPYMTPTRAVLRDRELRRRVNNVRWFGQRARAGEPFSRDGGPLSKYLPKGIVAGCPSFREFLNGFEAGCGGYGYNKSFVGQYVLRKGRRYERAHDAWELSGNSVEAFDRPFRTVAFTDTAFVDAGLIEYSFCEPPRFALSEREARPSIHFRHLGKANVAWLDTHVSAERITFSGDVGTGNPYAGSPGDFQVGWFGPRTNELFDCE
jgi:prepilin-type N-terminal cleavage/methylation domain-containing protein/prepilin-type processing-associated H-X9-DG protein